jgi:hypothetical protein
MASVGLPVEEIVDEIRRGCREAHAGKDDKENRILFAAPDLMRQDKGREEQQIFNPLVGTHGFEEKQYHSE